MEAIWRLGSRKLWQTNVKKRLDFAQRKVRFSISLFAGSGTAWAQPMKKDAAANFPIRPVRLIVPVPPGGSSDASARILGQKLTESFGQQVIVDNRAGAAEIIGTDIVAKANPDGYSVVLVSLRY